MKPGLRPVVSAGLLMLAALLSGVAGWYFGPRVLNLVQPSPPARTLPALSLPDLQGRVQTLQQWQGRILVVNLWASWCSPCRAEMPGFSRLQTKYAAKNVQFVGIALDQLENVESFIQSAPVSYPVLMADHSVLPVFSDLGNRAGSLPFTVIFTPGGQLRHVHRGYWQEGELDDILGELVAMMTK